MAGALSSLAQCLAHCSEASTRSLSVGTALLCPMSAIRSAGSSPERAIMHLTGPLLTRLPPPPAAAQVFHVWRGDGYAGLWPLRPPRQQPDRVGGPQGSREAGLLSERQGGLQQQPTIKPASLACC